MESCACGASSTWACGSSSRYERQGDSTSSANALRNDVHRPALAVVLGLIELFVTPYSPTSSSTVYDKLSGMQVVVRLFELAVRAFVLLLSAQLLTLWLDLIAEVRGLADRMGQRR